MNRRNAWSFAVLTIMLAAGAMASLQPDGLQTAEVSVTGTESTIASLAALELTEFSANGAKWKGAGVQAELVVHGAHTDTEVVGLFGSNEEPFTETNSFQNWQLSGGEWKEGYQVIVGIQPGMSANLSYTAQGESSIAQSGSDIVAQEDRITHDDEPLTYDVSEAAEWKGETPSLLRIEGDFVVSAWATNMRLASKGEEPQDYESGNIQSPKEGAEPAYPAVYSNERRINNLYVTDGWVEITVTGDPDFRLFTHSMESSVTGVVESPEATAIDDGEMIASGPLKAQGNIQFQLTPDVDASTLTLVPIQPDGDWTLDGEPIHAPAEARGEDPLPGDGSDPSQLDTMVADPSEGNVPSWAKILLWILFAGVMVIALEGSGVAPYARSKWRLSKYDYDAVQPRRYWKWVPAFIRHRLYFHAAIAAAGREDHDAAIRHADQVPQGSRYWKPSRFVSIQSLAARGDKQLALFNLEDLISRDSTYELLAEENPFLRGLVRK